MGWQDRPGFALTIRDRSISTIAMRREPCCKNLFHSIATRCDSEGYQTVARSFLDLSSQVSRHQPKEKSDVKETVRRGILSGVRYFRSRRPNEFPAPDNPSLGDESVGCLCCHPLQGFQRGCEAKERDVWLQQHDRIVCQHQPIEQPRDKLEHELSVEYAGLH